MLLSLILFFAGLLLLYYGAEYLIEGSSRLAVSFGVRPLIIGMTIVAFATSMPELLVTVLAALRGATDLAVGNVLGSNVANIGLILGSSALVAPLAVGRSILYRELPIMLIASLMFWLLSHNGIVGRAEGALLLFGLAVFLYYCLSSSKQDQLEEEPLADEVLSEKEHRRKDLVFILLGIVGLAVGAEMMVTGSTNIARIFGISELVIGLSIVAFGTSLPELAASIVSAVKGEMEISVGNVIGSNIFNILFVIGLSSSIRPLPVNPQLHGFQFPAMILIGALLYPMLWKKARLSRIQGGLLFLVYIAFIVVSFR